MNGRGLPDKSLVPLQNNSQTALFVGGCFPKSEHAMQIGSCYCSFISAVNWALTLNVEGMNGQGSTVADLSNSILLVLDKNSCKAGQPSCSRIRIAESGWPTCVRTSRSRRPSLVHSQVMSIFLGSSGDGCTLHFQKANWRKPHMQTTDSESPDNCLLGVQMPSNYLAVNDVNPLCGSACLKSSQSIINAIRLCF